MERLVNGQDGWKRWLGPAWEALCSYWPAFLVMQGVAAGVVIGYYTVPAVHGMARVAVGWKEACGPLGPALAAMLGSGVVPELVKWKMRRPGETAPRMGEFFHFLVLFGILGTTADAFYRTLGAVLGEGLEWWRVVTKIVIDQAVYSSLFVVPFVVVWMAWRENRYSVTRTLKRLSPRFFLDRVPPILAPNLMFWTPLLFAIYALPTDLQFVVATILGSAWALILVFIARRQGETRAVEGALG